ncbi:MAG: hypothetical protein FWD69_19265 [Polyangiaceae bacterium]|nr:hypothetical protein [Polyangiaceae bacterium]
MTAVCAAGFLVAGGGPTPGILLGATPGPFVLRDSDVIRLAVDGAADADAVFNGSAAAMAAGGASPYALADGMDLLLRIDNGLEQTVLFSAADFADIANATATEIAAAINARIVGGRVTTPGGILRLASDTEGTASRIQVTGGSANAVLAFPDAASVGGGNVANLRAVEVAEVKAVVETAIPTVQVEPGAGGVLDIRTVATGPAASVQANAATAAAFGLDTALHKGTASGTAPAVRVEGKDPGAYANRIEIEVRAATNGSPGAFDLLVVDDGTYRESFPNLSMDPDDARYVERIVNDVRTGSVYVRVIDQLLEGAPVPPPQIMILAGGSDASWGSTTRTSSAPSLARRASARSTRCRSFRCSSFRAAPRLLFTRRCSATAR